MPPTDLQRSRNPFVLETRPALQLAAGELKVSIAGTITETIIASQSIVQEKSLGTREVRPVLRLPPPESFPRRELFRRVQVCR
jgi:hypothetical protein